MTNPARLLDLWSEKWRGKGFEPRILSESDAKTHPGYSQFRDRIMRYPTVNNRQYELACYLRHMAMAATGEQLLVDYDVLPNPKVESINLPEGQRLLLLEPTRVPCAVLADQDGFSDICDLLYEFVPVGQKHVSDMTIIRGSTLPVADPPICVEHLDSGKPIENDPGDGWKTAPLIHFANYSFSKLGWHGDKADLITRGLSSL